MNQSIQSIWADLTAIRQQAPLVHNITNYVVMNTTANALLALGASPVMAHAAEEVVDMVALAKSLVINIGTLSEPWVHAMKKAMKEAQTCEIPLVLDPVGAGATPYRTASVQALLAAAPPSIIRGNASEILALVQAEARTKGVDSLASSESAVDAARELSTAHQCVVCVSGKIDFIVEGERVVQVANGHPLMPRVTGLGCTATALCGAFAAVNPSAFDATAHAMTIMGIAGELAAELAVGPGTLQLHFLDALYNFTEDDLKTHAKIS